MLVFEKPRNADEVSCPYITGEKFRQRYAFLKELDLKEFDMMLLNGWRHFGYFFFMPNCKNCNLCTPIRTNINEFLPSKSQRRNLKKNNLEITVDFEPLIFNEDVYRVYEQHSKAKFNQETSKEEFIESFFSDALTGNNRLSLYKVGGELVGVGFIDISETGISSIYFCYDTNFSSYGLGVFSVLKEIEYGKSLNKDYYYLGYYIKGNSSMEYKSRYTPCEYLSWEEAKWLPFKEDCTV